MGQHSKSTVGIVGGGMLGLTLALRLQQSGFSVTLLEAAPNLGGLASAWQVGNITWDRYYHVIMLSDSHLRSLLQELGLEEQIDWRVTRTNFYSGSDMYPLNNALDYIRLPALSLVDKIRLAATILYGSRIEKGQKLESVSAEKWLTKLSGKSTYMNLWRPLLRSKLGDNCDKASAAYIWSVIRRFYAARRGGMKTEMFGYVPGGYLKILAALEQKVLAAGIKIETGVQVTSIDACANEFLVRGKDQSFRFDQVINTCASPIATRMCPGLSTEEAMLHNAILYQGIVCASLVLERPLGGAYLTYITDESIPFTTVIEMSTLVDPASLDHQHLVYLPKYLPVNDSFFELSDQDVEDRFIAGLKKMFPDLQDNDIKACKISRTKHVLAISTQNYSRNLPPMRTSVPGLYIINSAQILNAALSVNDTISLANRGAECVIGDVSKTLNPTR